MLEYYKFFDYLRKHKIKQKELLDNRVVSMGTMQRLRANEHVNTSVIDRICNYLECDITDILDFVPDDEVGKEE